MSELGSESAPVGGGQACRGPWAVTAAGALAVMAALAFGRFSYTMLLPTMRDALLLSYTAAGLLATSNLVGYLFGSLFSVTILRRLGARATVPWALAALAFGLALTGIAHGVPAAAAGRAIAGAAGAVVYVQALGLVPQCFPIRDRGLASGLMHAGNGVGLVLTGLGLPFVVASDQVVGWRVGWGVLALVAVVLAPWPGFFFGRHGLPEKAWPTLREGQRKFSRRSLGAPPLSRRMRASILSSGFRTLST